MSQRPSSRITRSRRGSKASSGGVSSYFARIPEFMEEICEAWELRGKLVWWTADVIHIDAPTTPAGSVKGIIRYRAQYRYKAEDCVVQFISIPKRGSKTLRHLGKDSYSRETWKFPEEHVDLTQDCTIVQREVKVEASVVPDNGVDTISGKRISSSKSKELRSDESSADRFSGSPSTDANMNTTTPSDSDHPEPYNSNDSTSQDTTALKTNIGRSP